MIRTILTLAFAAATGAGGYVAGSVYPAPPQVIAAIDKHANEIRTQLNLQNVSFADLQKLVPQGRLDEIQNQLTSAAAAAGQVIMSDRDTSDADLLKAALVESMPAPAPTATKSPTLASPAAAPSPAAAAPLSAAVGGFETALSACPKMQITNSPPVDAQGRVTKYARLVKVKTVVLAADPAPGACLSSGFGERSGEVHKGVDYHSETGGPILAAGDGQILEMKYRDDYGNMIVIDHGGGVYTRYGHLASFDKGLSVGVKVKAGDKLGLMGNTAGYPVPVHLHYEVLTGDYNTPKQSFGLDPNNVFDFPSAG